MFFENKLKDSAIFMKNTNICYKPDDAQFRDEILLNVQLQLVAALRVAAKGKSILFPKGILPAT